MWGWLENGIARWTPSCREVARLASEALERRLTLRERLAMRIHFMICYLCRRYADQAALLHEGLHRHGELFTDTRDERLTEDEKRALKERCRREA
jgi:hypothetical protein